MMAAGLAMACAGPRATGTAASPEEANGEPRAGAAASRAPAPPSSHRQPVTDEYHGVTVVDDYRWLEDAAAPEVRQWTAAQNQHTRRYLDALPELAPVRRRVESVHRDDTTAYLDVKSSGGTWFVLVAQPPRQQPFLVALRPGQTLAEGRVVYDPNQVDPSAKTSIDWYFPSPDGKLVAASMSRAGTEMGDLVVIDAATGAFLPDTLTRVNGGTAGGDLAWDADGKGFHYTRYPRPGERPPDDLAFYVQVYHHRLGTPEASDRYEMGEGLPKIAEIQLEVEPAGRRVLATVQKGDGGEFSHFLRGPRGGWTKLTEFEDQVSEVRFGPRGELFVLSERGAPRGAVLRAPPGVQDLARAEPFLPEGPDTLITDFWESRSFLATPSYVYASYQLGGPSVIRAHDARGRELPFPAPREVASVSGLQRDGAGVLFHVSSFLEPAAWYRFDERMRAAHQTPLADTTSLRLEGASVVREKATSRDGTQVPLSILLPRGARAGAPGPCVVTGYGGYGVNIEPGFRLDNALLVERGVTVVVANLRGGGELGEDWHRQGSLENKQNVFDDFAAVLRHVIERGYTTPERLGIIGASNGGLLMGALLTQQPALVRAAVSFVGIYDMLRVERSPNGAFNVTEFGTVEDPGQFRALHAYSPYHRVRDGVAYPSVLLLTGENDPRVDPLQSRKMTARLQAASAGDNPILLRTSADTGHGSGTALDERIAERSDALAFLLHELGVEAGDEAAEQAAPAP